MSLLPALIVTIGALAVSTALCLASWWLYRDARLRSEMADHKAEDAENVRRAAYRLHERAKRKAADADAKTATAMRLLQLLSAETDRLDEATAAWVRNVVDGEAA